MPRGFRDEDKRYDNDEADAVSFEGVKCIRATAAAILCVIERKEVWLPQSVVHDDSEVFKVGDVGKLVIKGWFARKEGLVGA